MIVPCCWWVLSFLHVLADGFFDFDAYCCWKRFYMLKNAWLFIHGFFMEVKVDHKSDIEGSSIFLSSILNLYVLVSLLVGSFYCKL